MIWSMAIGEDGLPLSPRRDGRLILCGLLVVAQPFVGVDQTLDSPGIAAGGVSRLAQRRRLLLYARRGLPLIS
jgi:hypothetical protein